MNTVDRLQELLAPLPVWHIVSLAVLLIAITLGTVLVISLNRDIREAGKSIRNQ